MSQQTDTRRQEWREGILIALTIPLLAALAFAVFGCFRVFSIPASSMMPELRPGTYVVVSRLETGFNRYTFDWLPLPMRAHWPKGEMRRGDVVVFRLPSDRRTFYVKRIAGVPGDSIAMRKGRLVLNGKVVPREPATPVAIDTALDGAGPSPAYTETLPGGSAYTIVETEGDGGPLDDTQEVTVPADQVFVLGDNRDNSNDSRAGVGMVPIALINGKVVLNLN